MYSVVQAVRAKDKKVLIVWDIVNLKGVQEGRDQHGLRSSRKTFKQTNNIYKPLLCSKHCED